jgi:GT2 family glycosyltransferase
VSQAPTSALPSATIVIPVTNGWEATFRSLLALAERCGGVRREVIVVDNGSTDDTRLALPHLEGIRVIRNEKDEGFVRACNQAGASAEGDVLVFLDREAEVGSGWLERLARHFVDPGMAAVCPGESLCGAFLAVRTADYREANGLDEESTTAADELLARLLCRNRRVDVAEDVPIQVSSAVTLAPAPGFALTRSPVSIAVPVHDGAPTRTAQGGGEPLVSIVIPAFNKWSLTYRCLTSLLQHTRSERLETIVVDNGSTDETATALPRLAGIRVHRNAVNLGFAAACNQGASLSRAPYLLFLNNDTEVLPNWLPPMLRMMESVPKMAVVGSKLLFPDGTLQHGGVAVLYAAPLPVSPVHIAYRQPPEASNERLRLNAVTAACMLIRREVFDAVGGFDESYRNGCEDVDLCFKVCERGWLVGYTPESVLYHHESQSEGRLSATQYNENLLQRRWMGRFKNFDADRRRKPPAVFPRAGRPPVSVVLPVKDGLRGIAPCLEDLAANLGAGDHIVVADAGSRDCTLQFVDGFALEHPGLVRIVETDPAGDVPGAARAGVAIALNAAVVVLPRLVGMLPGSLDGFLTDLEKSPQGLAVFPLGDRGFMVGGERERIAALLDLAPGAIFAADAHALAQAAATTTTSAHWEAPASPAGERPARPAW